MACWGLMLELQWMVATLVDLSLEKQYFRIIVFPMPSGPTTRNGSFALDWSQGMTAAMVSWTSAVATMGNPSRPREPTLKSWTISLL